MKKGTVLNSDISSVISRLGHTDTLVVCDAGFSNKLCKNVPGDAPRGN